MTLRGSLIIFAIGTLVAWSAWAVVVTTVEPDTAGHVGEAFFLGSLFLALTGTLTLLGVTGRLRRGSKLPATYLGSAFRQGFLISVGVIGALLLQRIVMLEWWSILLLVLILFLLDLALAPRQRHTHL